MIDLSSEDLHGIVGGAGLGYGSRAYVNGQRGQVISHAGNPVIETRDFRGRSTGTTTLTGYDQVFRRVLNAVVPTFQVGPRNGAELKAFRSRGW